MLLHIQRQRQLLVLLLALGCYHKSPCMDFFKKAAHKATQQWQEYKEERAIKKAFKALACNDYKMLAALAKDSKIFPHSENKQGVTLFGQLLETKNHRALIPLFCGQLADEYLCDVPRIRAWLRDGPTAPFERRPRDDQPLHAEEILSYLVALGIIIPPLFCDLCRYDDIPDFINRSLKNDALGVSVMPYVHEQAYLSSCAYEEQTDNKTKHEYQKKLFALLLPHFSPRAFESITEHAVVPERDLPKTNALINRQHTEWKAMSKKRNEIVNEYIYPCEDIVREYLEGNEYEWIEYLLSTPLYDRWQKIDLNGKIPVERHYLQENIIMDYVGGFEYLQEQEMRKRYNTLFQKLYQRFKATELDKIAARNTIEQPTQLIVEYSEEMEE